MLDDDQRVAQIAQALERLEQAGVVALVQADGGLVEDVQNAHQRRADLRGQADALRLAAGERAGAARERQVVKAHVREEAQAGVDLLQDLFRNELLPLAQFRVGEKGARAVDGHVRDLGDGLAAHRHRQRLAL